MRVVIVASDATAAETIRRAMRYAPTCRVIGWIDQRRPCAGPLAEARPDVVVIDGAGAPEAVMSCARDIRASMPDAKIVLLSDDLDASVLADATAVGVNAAIAKTASPASVGMLVREVAAGHVFHFAPVPAADTAPADEAARALTARELEILRLVAAGRPNGPIARELWVTEQTVKFHLSNIYRKLGLANRTEASHYAHVHGLLPTESKLLAA
jgi:DNA-binding NarL/FixJ family response regulator